MDKLVIIPAYNESRSIVKVVGDIRENAPDFDYVVINDCSTDNTKEVCEINDLNHINLPINLGIGGAVQTGYLYAYKNGYNYASQFDGDGQHRAVYLERMLEKMKSSGADMVVGSRYIQKEGFQSSFLRRFGIKYFSLLIKLLTGSTVTDPTSGMRLANRDVIEEFVNYYPKDYPEPESLVMVLGSRKCVEEVPVIMNERTEGVSSISPLKAVYYMLKVTLASIIARFRK